MAVDLVDTRILDISDSTCDDLVFLLRSHLEVSLRGLFQSKA